MSEKLNSFAKNAKFYIMGNYDKYAQKPRWIKIKVGWYRLYVTLHHHVYIDFLSKMYTPRKD